MPLGLYLAVPFCRSKCSFCNFASQVHSPRVFSEYCALLVREIELAAAQGLEGAAVDTVYWGGGTPSLLAGPDFTAVARALREHFRVLPGAEHTVEVAPGTLRPDFLEAMLAAGVNRVSLGVQSFVDGEARAVGRLHDAAVVARDLRQLRAAGLHDINLDLIAGLPHQTLASWRSSLEQTLAAEPAHVSVYMLEVDEESRLGGELLAGGARYHAHHVPDDDLIADAYLLACEQLECGGIGQYEISNFARPGSESLHNQRYWLRQPYRGFGLDAHSLLAESRFANPDSLAEYLEPLRRGMLPCSAAAPVTPLAALEETLFLGLRRNAGLTPTRLDECAATVPGFGEWVAPKLERLRADGLLTGDQGAWRLSAQGRLLANRVFTEFLGFPASV
ncbi:MAG TPA: radical SAM family heme chaperone HemW [Terriglobales bacterium]|nr:radical SAM family heme chaperone HemW [Terriglobales bacterium]